MTELVRNNGTVEICDNCTQAEPDSLDHRCRADETSCVDGLDCPDFIEKCECTTCNFIN